MRSFCFFSSFFSLVNEKALPWTSSLTSGFPMNFFHLFYFKFGVLLPDQMSVCILLNVALRFIMTVVFVLPAATEDDAFDPLDDMLDAAML